MMGFDTNVIVRHLTDDDPTQSPVAHSLFNELSDREPGYISLVALVETCWVLSRAYQYNREWVYATVDRLLSATDLVLQEADVVWEALREARAQERDIPDAIIAALGRRSCERTWTFDRKALVLDGMCLAVEGRASSSSGPGV